MDVQIRLFAQLRELMGSEILHEQFAAERVTVAELQRRLEDSRPQLRPYLPVLALAINEEYCLDAGAEIREGDEVALIQPISGGSGGVAPFAVTEQPLDRDALRELVRTDASGAVVLFEGVVRDHHEGHAVLRLEYEAYASMAARQLEAVGREVLAEFAERARCTGWRRIIASARWRWARSRCWSPCPRRTAGTPSRRRCARSTGSRRRCRCGSASTGRTAPSGKRG